MALSNRALQLAQLFVSVLDSDDLAPHPVERVTIVTEVMRWGSELSAETAESVVDTALHARRSGLYPSIEALADDLYGQLTEEECLRLLGDLGRVARADGRVSTTEARAIARARTVLGTRRPA